MASTTSYIINFNKKNSVFTLTSTKDELKVDAKHKKYEWLKSQATGRIVKISDKGRWNSSKDYIGLYDEINSSASKKKSTVKSSVTTKRKAKPVKDNSTELKELKTQLKELQTSNNNLKTENTSLRNEIQLLKKKPLPAKPKPSKPKPVAKQYRARMTGKHSYYSYTDWAEKNKLSETLDITIITQKLYKKPSQSFFKSYIKLAAQETYYKGGKLGMAIDYVYGLSSLKTGLCRNSKISSIQFISIEED
jgi:regulator of replication initiation timing